MTAYIIRRLLLMIPVAFLVSVIIFVVLHLTPGDPILVLFGEEPDPTVIANLRHAYGLDRPLPVQYLTWITRMLHGDMGRSIRTQQPVTHAIFERLPNTLELGLAALVFGLVVSIPVGILSATRRNSVWDLLGTSVPLLGISIPNFFTGIILILLFALVFRIFTPGGFVPFSQAPRQNIRDLVLPMITLGLPSLAVNMRFMRSGLIDALGHEYTRVARAKGLTERRVVVGHALKNAFIPFVTIVGLQIGGLLEGAFITETIFLWPGVGRLAVDSINGRDYPVVQGIVLLSALSYMTVNLIVDLLYGFLDPRIKFR
ncbi:MAG TPA: ABC transporter permease [Thermomicrobiaceae bacterium]|nr:ABC transporter permease [Thermomicrobiaceae bacterium]